MTNLPPPLPMNLPPPLPKPFWTKGKKIAAGLFTLFVLAAGSPSAKNEPAMKLMPQNPVAAAKAEAEVNRVGRDQYTRSASVRSCKLLGDMVRISERADFIAGCIPDQIKWCREMYDGRGFC